MKCELQIRLPGFAPPQVHRCRVCGKRLTRAETVAAGIGPKCKAAEDADEQAFLDRMGMWNVGSYSESRQIKVNDFNRLLGIIGRLKKCVTVNM